MLVVAAAFANLANAAKINLSRVTPVPATEQVPVLDFFRPPLLRDPKLNLAGTHIAALITADDDHTELIVSNLKTQAIDRISVAGDKDIASVEWLDSKRFVYGMTFKRRTDIGLYTSDAGSGLTPSSLVQYVGCKLIAVPRADRLHPVVKLDAMGMNTSQYGEVFIMRTDIFTSPVRTQSGVEMSMDAKEEVKEVNQKHFVSRYPILKTNQGCDIRYIADKDGKLAFGIKVDENGTMTLHQLTGENWQQCPQDLEEITIVDAGDNPGEIVVVGERKDGKPRPLQVMEASSGKVLSTLLEDNAYDFDGSLYRDPKTYNIVGAIGNRSGPTSIWFNEGYSMLQKYVEKLSPGQVVRILGNDEAGKVVLISSSSDRQPPIYSWVDLEKHTAGVFKNSAPWIDPQRMQPMNVMKFKTRDGKQLDAYVTLPKGATKQNPAPLVVLAHGGPGETRDTWGYNAEVQFLASRGYAVLQPNYRGSPGYNWMFPTEDEWAYRKMHEDVTEATKKLLATGLIDRNRMAIMGTSFGGYLALCGVAFEPSLYKCAVAVSANYDWGKLISARKYDKFNGPSYARMFKKLGDPKKESEKFSAMSPLKHASDIGVPVFISYSEFDANEETSMAKDLVSTVKRKGIPAESISFIDEANGVRYLENKVELYGRIEAFLAKNLGAGTR
ncbi:MAG: alpha/beta fold hydrolase [Opitutaceae bacterium]